MSSGIMHVCMVYTDYNCELGSVPGVVSVISISKTGYADCAVRMEQRREIGFG